MNYSQLPLPLAITTEVKGCIHTLSWIGCPITTPGTKYDPLGRLDIPGQL
jgi:hypothetical protein